MIIKDLFEKKIDRSIEGVVTIGNETEEQKWQELEEYVCTDEIVKSFRTFFRKYRESLTHPTKGIGVWITGFFGSGKSHFLKILGYILENEEVAGWEATKYFEEKIDDSMVIADLKQCAKANNKVVLFNIDSKAKSDSKSKNQAIMDIMLRSFNEAVGYCGTSPWVADMERTLDEEGKLAAFISKFEELSGREWVSTRAKALLNRDYIIKALVAVRDMTEESAKQFVDDQTKNFTNSTEEFAQIVDNYCKKNNTRVIFLMDEVGQFIGDNTQLMLNLQTCVEDLGKYCRGQAWVVVTSQQELKAMIESTRDKQQDFSKIQGRFDTRLLLSGSNADEVIKKRILDKKKNAIVPLESMYDASSNKLSNLILFPAKPTWSGYSDAKEFADVYPFVTYQFELLQKVFEAIREHGMSEGKHLSQNERSLLSAFQDSAKKYADENSGILVPFDSFYSTIEQFIDYDIKTVFSNAERRATLDEFSIRVLKVLFMIRHVKEMPATIDRLATLMVGSIDEDKAELKNRILVALDALLGETLIQKNGEVYEFLTSVEQDVENQINKAAFNEGEVQRTILDIVYDKILETNKYRYEGRYDFGLNRYVDSESKGSFNQENITIKFATQFSSFKDVADYTFESSKINGIVVDLTEGTFVEELVRASKIYTFKRNNEGVMSASLTDIMSKKVAEASDRTKRAEDIIRTVLRTAPIYLAGHPLDIKSKEGKDRVQEAFKEYVKREYYKIGLVSYYYQDQKSILSMLNSREQELLGGDSSQDSNQNAYKEISDKIKDDKNLSRTSTVKSLIDFFAKKPYGWRDLDTLGMVALMWKRKELQISIHDNVIDENDSGVKNDLAHKNKIDTMVVRIQEKIDDEILFKVKQIMNNIYAENIPLDENQLKDRVITFFKDKKKFIEDLRVKNGSTYAGSKAATEIYKDFDAITKTSDPLTVFNEVIAREDSLKNNSDLLEQLEAFYKDGSSQQKNFEEAKKLSSWYQQNKMLEDLSAMDDVITRIDAIVQMEMPFSKMTELANLVFQANEEKTKVIDAKYKNTIKRLEYDRDSIGKETSEVMKLELTEDQKNRIQVKADEIGDQYDQWFKTLTAQTSNLDSYITASSNTLRTFKAFIANIMSEGQSEEKRSKRVRVIDCIPMAKKKLSSSKDVDVVVNLIKEKLLLELESNDEIDLD